LQKINKEVEFAALMQLIEEKLSMDGEVNILATGNSMYPLFRHKRDQVLLGRAETGKLKKYDMILYRRDSGQYVLHRIVGEKKDGYVLRGDHQLWDEYPVRPDQVIAKVRSFSRNGRQTSCEDMGYRIYVQVWTHTVLLRRAAARGKSLLRRLLVLRRK